MKATASRVMFLIAGTVALTMVWFGTSDAGVHVGVSYTSAPADVQVWLGSAGGHDGYYNDGYYSDGYYDGGVEYDVYPSQDDVVLYVRAPRSCYTTVYIIDTEGFVHVVHPLSPAHDAYLIGGRVYRYRLRDFGFYGQCFDRGVAYAFAVGSPLPFNYAYYGAGIFGPQIGFRIYGDPFVASRMFYASILPPACHWNLVAVSYACFYVREYQRYPRYLCAGWHDYHGVRTYCRGNCGAHRQYRAHAADPYQVIHPQREFRPEVNPYAKIDRTASKDIRDIRIVSKSGDPKNTNPRVNAKTKQAVEASRVRAVQNSDSKRTVRRIESADRGKTSGVKDVRTATVAVKKTSPAKISPPVATERDRVVRSTRNSFIKSKNDFSKMREKFDSQNTNGKGVKKAGPTQATKSGQPRVRENSPKETKVAQSNTPAKAGKGAKRTKK